MPSLMTQKMIEGEEMPDRTWRRLVLIHAIQTVILITWILAKLIVSTA